MKNIRSKVVKQSLLDYNTLAKSLQENTEGAVKNLLSETVRDTYAKLLSEGDEFDEDEVDDVDGEVEDTATDAGNSDEADIDTVDDSDIDAGTDADADGDDWAEFDKYKVSDDEYDFSNAEDEEIVKVYKLMKNDDQILVHKDDDKVKIQDNETGAEYIVDLGGDDSASLDSDDEFDGGEDFEDDEDIDGGEPDFELEIGGDSDDENFDDDADLDSDMDEFGDDEEDFDDEDFDDDEDEEGEDTFELETDNDGEDIENDDDFSDEDSDDNNEDEKDNMKESTERMFELVLEYDSNVGYTDNYQSKDVMTTPDMSEPGKNVNDWDAGVPKGKSKPWSGKKGGKKENQPFDGEKGKTVEESIHTVTQNGPQRRSTTIIQAPDTSRSEEVGRNLRLAKIPGQKKGTGEASYTGVKGGSTSTETNESIIKKVNKTLKENKELKNTLGTVMTSLKEAAVTNHNLAQIIKLISENSTTKEEKEEIIRKFANEAKTIDASKALYESLSNDLKKAKKMNITEGTLLSAESSKKINETPIYKSQDIMESLDLMHRMMK